MSKLLNFISSLPEDIQVALDELMEEGFEIDLTEFYGNIFINIFSNSKKYPYPYFNPQHKTFVSFAAVETILIKNLTPDLLKKIVRNYDRKETK